MEGIEVKNIISENHNVDEVENIICGCEGAKQVVVENNHEAAAAADEKLEEKVQLDARSGCIKDQEVENICEEEDQVESDKKKEIEIKQKGPVFVRKKVEYFEVGPCDAGYELGFLIGKRFCETIRIKLEKDRLLRTYLLPFAEAQESKHIMEALFHNNKTKYPTYWDELTGLAEGSGVPVLEIILVNLKREIIPFLKDKVGEVTIFECADDCTDLHIVSDSLAIGAHNEDAYHAMAGHDYLIKAKLNNGITFVAYTHAAELCTRAFAFNSNGVAFTTNLVRPLIDEIVPGAIGRNFVVRDLLESTGMDDAIARIKSAEVSIGHNYNLVDVVARRVVNVETASRLRFSQREIGATPSFHGNLYKQLHINEERDDYSVARETRANALPKESKDDFLNILGDTQHQKYPIYMDGPMLYTMCTVLFDMDQQTLTIYQGNPKNKTVSYVFSLSELRKP